MDDKVKLNQEWLNDVYGDLYKKVEGYELTLREMVQILLKDSDNTALRGAIEATTNLELDDRALVALDVDFTETETG